MKEAYIVYKSQYDEMELLFLTVDFKEAENKLVELKNIAIAAKEKMESVNKEFGTEMDEAYWTHYDRMYINKEISITEYDMAKYGHNIEYNILKWDGTKFFNIIMKKYTFTEYVAATESKDFDSIEPHCLTWAQKLLKEYFNTDLVHEGDCTKQSHTCLLCLMEAWLSDYNMYFFKEDEWRKENNY